MGSPGSADPHICFISPNREHHSLPQKKKSAVWGYGLSVGTAQEVLTGLVRQEALNRKSLFSGKLARTPSWVWCLGFTVQVHSISGSSTAASKTLCLNHKVGSYILLHPRLPKEMLHREDIRVGRATQPRRALARGGRGRHGLGFRV